MWSTQTDKNTFLFSPLPWYFCNFGSNSAFFDVTDVHRCSKVDSLFLVFPELLVLLLTFSEFHAGIVSSFSHSLSTAASASWIFFACEFGINVCTKLWWVIDVESLLKMRSSCFVSIEDSTHCLVDSWDSTIHSHIVLSSVHCQSSALRSFWRCLAVFCTGWRKPLVLPLSSSKFWYFSEYSLSSRSTKNAVSLRSLSSFGVSLDHSCFFSVLSGFTIFVQTFNPYMILSGCCLDLCQSLPDHMYPFGGFSLSEWFV